MLTARLRLSDRLRSGLFAKRTSAGGLGDPGGSPSSWADAYARRVQTEALLAEQKRYYRERAPEYDDWWFRRGRYALDADAESRWFAECGKVETALERFAPRGEVLELACGTGLWTGRLAGPAARVTAVDASAEMISLNRRRLGPDAAVEYVQADLFEWRPRRAYDVCFFGFWLSHVPEALFDDFWRLVRSALRPDGRVFLVDSGAGDIKHTRVRRVGEREVRRLADGREFEIVKRLWAPEALADRVRPLGFELDVRKTANGLFVHGGGR